jgi:hypothetical protein
MSEKARLARRATGQIKNAVPVKPVAEPGTTGVKEPVVKLTLN